MTSIAQCRPGLGTYIKISISGDAEEEDLLTYSQDAFAEIERIEHLLSFHDPNSELSQINRRASLEPRPMSSDLHQVLTLAQQLSERTDGLFDLTVARELLQLGSLPDHGVAVDPEASWKDVHIDANHVFFARKLVIDLGGIAKGYAVDRAFEKIPTDLRVQIDAGGDLRMRPWYNQEIGIRIPGGKNALVSVPMFAPAVATSAGYFSENGHSIICPRTRAPLQDVRSVSVYAPNCMLADALTKVVSLSPDPSGILRQRKALAVLVDPRAETTILGI